MHNTLSTLSKALETVAFLSASDNPVILKAVQTLNRTQFVANVLGQYYGLVIEVPHFLSEMAIIANTQGWNNIEREVIRNRAEEYGSRTNGIPHRTLFSSGVRSELGVYVEQHQRSTETHKFLSGLMTALTNHTPEFALGVIYALEDTATPELLVVGQLISTIHKGVSFENLSSNDLAAKDRQTPADQLSLEAFLRMHIVDFEIGHREGLKTAIAKDLGETTDEFKAGYKFVINSMETWWKNLATTC